MFNYYSTNITLQHQYGYSLIELENQIPFERKIYIRMIAEILKKIEDAKNAASA